MVKLREQLISKEARPTRTQRVIEKQEEVKRVKEKRDIQKAREFLEEATYENYEERYNKLSPQVRRSFISPSELKQTKEYKEYIVQKQESEKKVEEYKKAKKEAEDYDAGFKIGLKSIEGQTGARLEKGASKAMRQGYSDALNQRENFEFKQKLKLLELKPIYKDPKVKKEIVGFEDEKRKQSYAVSELKTLRPDAYESLKDFFIPEKKVTELPEIKEKKVEEKKVPIKIDTKTKFFPGAKIDLPGVTPEYYSSQLGAFVKQAPGIIAGGTGIIRPPTQKERVKIEEAERRGEKLGFQIFKTPQLALGEIFKAPISEELKEERFPPVIKASGEIFEREQDIKDFNVMAEKLNKLNARFEKGDITRGEYEARYEANYDPKLERRAREYETFTSIRQDIATSRLTPIQRAGTQFTIEAVSVLPYLTGGGRVLLGGLQALEGSYRLGEAKTKEEERRALGQIGLGSFVGATGFKTVSSGIGSLTGRLKPASQLILGTSLVGGVGVGTGYQIFKETGDLPSAIGGGLGAVTPIAIGLGAGTLKQRKIKAENIKREKINYLKEKKLESLKTAQKRIEAGQEKFYGGTRGYKEVGVGKKFLSPKQQISLAKEYSKATGRNFDDSLKLVKESSIYQQKVTIKSDALSYQRAIDFIKTGKGRVGNNVLTYKRYGILETTKTGETARSFALEFNLRGSKISRIGAKVTVAKDKYGLTQVLEKARQRTGLPSEFRPKELLVTKAKDVKLAKKGETKFIYTETETRLLKSYSGKNLLKQQRVSFDEIYKGKKNPDKIILRDPNLVTKPEDLYKISGREAGKTYFRNIRAESPVYKEVLPGIKVKQEGAYKFATIGKGEGDLPNRLGFVRYAREKALPIKYKPKTNRIKIDTQGKSDLKETITDLSNKNQKVQLEQGKQLTTKEVAEQISKSTFDIRTSPQVRLEPKLPELTQENIVTFGSSSKAIGNINKEIQGYSLKEILKEKIKQDKLSKQKTDIGTKQVQKLGVSQLRSLDLKQEIKQLGATGTVTLQQQKITTELLTPNIPTPPITPIPIIRTPPITPQNPQIPIPLLIPILEGKRKKKKRRLYGGIERVAYLPDFTSRALGLAPEVITEEGARKKLKQVITGFELRRGVIIR